MRWLTCPSTKKLLKADLQHLLNLDVALNCLNKSSLDLDYLFPFLILYWCWHLKVLLSLMKFIPQQAHEWICQPNIFYWNVFRICCLPIDHATFVLPRHVWPGLVWLFIKPTSVQLITIHLTQFFWSLWSINRQFNERKPYFWRKNIWKRVKFDRSVKQTTTNAAGRISSKSLFTKLI